MDLRAYGRLVLLLGVASAWHLQAQPQLPQAELPPQAGEIRDGAYFNYFFGLSYPFPQHWSADVALRVTSDPSRRDLLFISSRPSAVDESALVISADPLGETTAKKYLERKQHQDNLNKFKRMELGGQEYFRAETDNVFAPFHVVLVCFRRQYALVFTVSTTDRTVVTNADRLVMPVQFSELKMPQEFAERLRESRALPMAATHGAVAGYVYSNAALGFAFTFPQGWRVLDPRDVPRAVPFGSWPASPAAAPRGKEPNAAPGATHYLFGAADPNPPPNEDRSRLAIVAEDLLGTPEIEGPIDVLVALNLRVGRSGQHSRKVRAGKIGGQPFAAQEIVLSGRDSSGTFANRYIGNFVTVEGRTALVFIFISPTQRGLYRASTAINSFHRMTVTGGGDAAHPARQ